MTPAEYLRRLDRAADQGGSKVVVMAGPERVNNGLTWASLDLLYGVYDDGGFQVARFAIRKEAEQYVSLRTLLPALADVVEAAVRLFPEVPGGIHAWWPVEEDENVLALRSASRRLAAVLAAVEK